MTLRSLSLVSGVIPDIRSHLLSGPLISDRQETTLARLGNEGLRARSQLIKYYSGIWIMPRVITATIWERLSGRSFRLLTLHCNNSLRGVQCAWMFYCTLESWTLIHSWERRPPVPSPSFKAIGKQLSKLLEAVQDVLPTPRVALLFTSIHNQFLSR